MTSRGLRWVRNVLAAWCGTLLVLFWVIAHAQDVPQPLPPLPRIGSEIHYTTQWQPQNGTWRMSPETIGDHLPGVVVRVVEEYKVNMVTFADIHVQSGPIVNRVDKVHSTDPEELGTWHWPAECDK